MPPGMSLYYHLAHNIKHSGSCLWAEPLFYSHKSRQTLSLDAEELHQGWQQPDWPSVLVMCQKSTAWAEAGISLGGCTRWHCATTIISAYKWLQIEFIVLKNCFQQKNKELHCANWLIKTHQSGHLLSVIGQAVKSQQTVLERHEPFVCICLKALYQCLQTSQNGYILLIISSINIEREHKSFSTMCLRNW